MKIKHAFAAAAALAIVATHAPPAHALVVTRAFSGLWHESGQGNRGFGAEVVDTAAGRTLSAYWITRDAAGKPLWVIAEGKIVGNGATLAAVTGAATGAATAWGTLVVTFSDCAHGSVKFAPSDARQPSGTTTIARLNADSAKSCTGGISDDRVASNDSRIVQFFTNTGVAPAASGRARFEQRSDRTDFNVEAEDLPAGAYSLRVAGSERATMNVAQGANGSEGEVEFRSPVEPGKLLLDFDPRGQLVELAQGDTVFLTTTLPTSPGDGGGGGNDNAATRYVLRLGRGHDAPQLKAEYDVRAARTEFSAELEHIPAGSYDLAIGGVVRGTIDVVAVGGGTHGELEFRTPSQPGHLPLDFDPRGQLVEIRQGSKVRLSGTFPTTGVGNGGGGGNGGPGNGGGNDDPPGDDHGGGGGGNDDPPGDDHGGGGHRGGGHH